MERQQGSNINSILELVEEKIRNIMKSRFGEVRIIIRNGSVYRILSTEDELVEEVKIKK